MAITAVTYVTGRDITTLTAAVTAKLGEGYSPLGAPVLIYNLYVQTMVQGTEPGSVAELQASIARIDSEAAALVLKLNADTGVEDEDYSWTPEA